jgi:hypothetical protein
MMSALVKHNEAETADGSTLSRRTACAMFTLGSLMAFDAQTAAVADPSSIDADLADRFALKRRAYQTGDANLLRSFYDDDIVIVGESMVPLLGIEPAIAAYQVLLPKRRDIEVAVLRSGAARGQDMAYQFVKFTAFARDPAETLPIVTFLFLWRKAKVGWRCVVELLLRQDLSLTPGFPLARHVSAQGDAK